LRADLPALKKPNDAIHLASALWHSVDTFQTYDRDDLLPLTGMLECRDGKRITICKPPDRPPPPPPKPSLFDVLEGASPKVEPLGYLDGNFLETLISEALAADAALMEREARPNA
jgi:hypothetical protein